MINLQFQNLNQANSEILKAFNSANSAKALEAYQPLSTKERKLQKLKALQILKQSSDSANLQEISLDTGSLSIALTKADGATLQAMLNLLSAKMIEQNKSVMGFNLIYLYENASLLEEILGALSTMDLGKPYVGHSFEFDKLKDAINLFQTGNTTGKVVVTV